jgi:hypothetical protein
MSLIGSLQADMMGGISGLPVARKMRSSSCLTERPRSGRHRQRDHPVADRGGVRFVAIAIFEAPIAGRARWFVRRPTVTDAAVSTWCFRPYVSPARSFKWIAGITIGISGSPHR